MGHSLYFSFIQHESRFDKGFSISGGTGVSDFGAFWKLGIDFLDSLDRGSQRASVIVAVKRVKQSTIFAYYSCLSCGRAGIDAQVAVSFICRKIAGLYIVLALAAVKFFIILFCGKERLHTVYLKIHFYGSFQPVSHGSYGNSLSFWLCIKSRADGCKQMRIFRNNGMLLIQF